MTPYPGKRLTGPGLPMPLDFRLKQKESETELRVHFISTCRVNARKRKDLRQGQAFHSSVRMTSRRKRRTALSQDWGRWAALDPHSPFSQTPRAFSKEFSSYRNAGAHHNTSKFWEIYWGTRCFSTVSVQKIWGWKSESTYKPNNFHKSSPFLPARIRGTLISWLISTPRRTKRGNSRWLVVF